MPRFQVDNLVVVDHVGDPLVVPDMIRPLFNDVLNRKYFLSYSGSKKLSSEFATQGYDAIYNIFFMSEGEHEEKKHVDIELIIENVYYGPPQDNMRDILVTTWLFGPLLASLTATDSEIVNGYVQYRATVRYSEYPEPVIVVGQGAAAGPIMITSRSEALKLAAGYAIWDVMYLVVEEMDDMWHLDVHKGFEAANWDEYREIVGAWIEGVK